MKVSIIAVSARERLPYVNATVEDVRVRFLDRVDAHQVGWQCEMHGRVDSCVHVEALVQVLAARVWKKLQWAARTYGQAT